MSLGVIILAGGRSTRMGADKATVLLDGRPLITILLASLGRVPGVDQVVVVSPSLTLEGVTVVSEDPPFGGPVAGIAAGADALSEVDLVGVVSVDAPDAAAALPQLVQALEVDADADVAVIRAADGYLQPLCAVWRIASLARALASLSSVRDVAAKKLLAGAEVIIEVPGDGSERDYDTAAELAERGEVDFA